jgi:YggT family protein
MVVWAIIGLVLWVCFIIVWIRLIVEVTRQFARRWRPSGVAAIGIEAVYASTDLVLRPLRRLLPPVRVGTVSLDLSVPILIIAILALRQVVLSLP